MNIWIKNIIERLFEFKTRSSLKEYQMQSLPLHEEIIYLNYLKTTNSIITSFQLSFISFILNQ